MKAPKNLEEVPSVLTPHELRAKGFRVRVVQRRFYDNLPYPVTKEQASGIKLVYNLGAVYPRGGITEIYIQTNNSTKTLKGVSECSVVDNFNKKLGVKLATWRALNSV